MFDEGDPLLARLTELCLSLPGAERAVSHGRPVFRCGKLFAQFGGSIRRGPGDHEEVPAALLVKIDPVELEAIDSDPRFFVPAYVGPYGWRGIDLAAPTTEWAEVAELVDASFRLTAPRRRVAELDTPAG